jgi:RNA polymerase sigma-70 factor (ECF subfamily)
MDASSSRQGSDRLQPSEAVRAKGCAVDVASQIALRERFAAGDESVLEECYAEYGPMVLGYLRRYVSADEAEDVLQKVMLDAWGAHRRYDPSRSLEAWLLGIARKRAIDSLRRRKRDVVSLDDVRELSDDDGRETAERFAWAAEVRSALGRLPEVQREAIELAYFAGMTQSEIARRLDVPLGTVKARTARGMQRLAAMIETGGAG